MLPLVGLGACRVFLFCARLELEGLKCVGFSVLGWVFAAFHEIEVRRLQCL